MLRYSLLRTMLLFGCLLVLWLLGGLPHVGWLREPVWLLMATAFTSLALSYFVLRGPREELARNLAERVSERTERRTGRLRQDEDDEDRESGS